MTYCVAVSLKSGIVFTSDSRTHAGVDQVASYSKMHTFGTNGERQLVLLSAGNLATTQSVLAALRHGIEDGGRSLMTVETMNEAADYLGEVSRGQQTKHAEGATAGFDPQVTWILGGHIGEQDPRLFLVYPQGNHIEPPGENPYFQIGETKFGKPILDRIVSPESSLEEAARCALVSMDYTMRANVAVGPPIEMLVYTSGTLELDCYFRFEEDDPYLSEVRKAWSEALKATFRELPKVPWSAARTRSPDG